MTERAEQYLARKKNSAKGEDADVWQKFEQLHSKKLWHELAVAVRSFVNSPLPNTDLKEMYDSFISEFAHRMNPLQLVEIALPVASYVFAQDRTSAFEFLSKMERLAVKDKTAVARVHVGQLKLKLENKDKHDRCIDIDAVREELEKTRKEVDDLIGVGPVHAPFYRVSAVYYKEVGDYASYYREALRYLGVEDMTKLTEEEKHVHAVLLGFAALLGENIYNLGELLAHPILSSLEGTPEKWIVDLLFAFNSGDIDKLLALERYWGEWDDLKRRREGLLNKIRLLALMELSLQRTSKNRKLSFSEIANSCKVEQSNVEHLVMRALSKKLIRGEIDEVQQSVLITWVQPRVLDTKQMKGVAARISQWNNDVASMESLVAENAREILTRA